jgi:biopolymer transport protein ExbB/TolQ
MHASKAPHEPGRRRGATLFAFLIGLPLAAAVLGAVHRFAPHDSVVARYLHHPVENVEVVLFCCALGTLAAKLWANRGERRAFAGALPAWDGKPVPPAEASRLLGALTSLPRRLHSTTLALRVRAVLDFLRQRGSADELDDQLRALADNDAIALDHSYSLTRFITWAMPILGFLGTVLGITAAIAGISPKDLESSDGIGAITGGLALSFDATALALGLTMITMFLTFLVERAEEGVLEEVDRYVERELAHRFARRRAASGPASAALEQHTQTVLDATARLVERQAAVWAESLAASEQRAAQRLADALSGALEQTAAAHAKRLAALEAQFLEQSGKLLEQTAALAAAVRDTGLAQQEGLARVADGVCAQAEALGMLQHNEKQLIRLQEALHQNLTALAGAGAFEQAVHTLTAAVHILTSRVPPVPAQMQVQAARMAAASRAEPGKAA